MDAGNQSGIHGNGLFQTSAIARLLVANTVRANLSPRPKEYPEIEPPLDLSFARKRPNVECNAKLSHSPGTPARRSPNCNSPSPAEDDTGKRKCPYCSYVAPDGHAMYRHYQYHRQMLASLPITSLSSAECTPKEGADVPVVHITPSQSPDDVQPSENSTTLRSLLQTSDKRPQAEGQSASKYLRSIVQTIIKQRTPIGGSGYSSRVSSRPLTPVPQGSRGSSRIASPARDAAQITINVPTPPTSTYELTPNVTPPRGYEPPANVQSPVRYGFSQNQHWSPRTHEDRGHVINSQWFDGGRSGSVSDVQVVTSRGRQVKRESEDSGEETSSTIGYETDTFSPRQKIRKIQRDNTKDASVQCELQDAEDDCQAADSATCEPSPSRCVHCGVTFDDEVMFSIHMGCHNHKDPFICNVCGKGCGNKYAFYTHIMRGHEYS